MDMREGFRVLGKGPARSRQLPNGRDMTESERLDERLDHLVMRDGNMGPSGRRNWQSGTGRNLRIARPIWT